MNNQSICQECIDVENYLHLYVNLLFHKLAEQKQNNLDITNAEKEYLCLSLLGYELIDIAKKKYEKILRNKLHNSRLSSEKIDKLVNKNIQIKA